MHGRQERAYRFWWGDPREGENLEDVGTDRRIILKLILKKGHGEALAGFRWLRIGTGGGHLGKQ
jgi:hypothetical protein